MQVAVKILTNTASEVERVKFLQEAAIMGQFYHPNIVRLHGVVTVGDPVYMHNFIVNSTSECEYGIHNIGTDCIRLYA